MLFSSRDLNTRISRGMDFIQSVILALLKWKFSGGKLECRADYTPPHPLGVKMAGYVQRELRLTHTNSPMFPPLRLGVKVLIKLYLLRTNCSLKLLITRTTETCRRQTTWQTQRRMEIIIVTKAKVYSFNDIKAHKESGSITPLILTAVLNILEKNKVSCLCRELNPQIIELAASLQQLPYGGSRSKIVLPVTIALKFTRLNSSSMPVYYQRLLSQT